MFVEGVEHGDLGGTAIGFDGVGDRLQRLAGATGEEDARAFSGELSGDRAPDGAAAP
jgi:hypothetical protein